MGNDKGKLSDVWKNLFRKHWKMIMAVIAVIAYAGIAAILVFLWVVDNGQASGLLPGLLGEWTVGIVITFILHLILWEVLFVVVPVAVAAFLLYWTWYRKLPPGEKLPTRVVTPARSSGGFSFLICIVWLIIVWLDGRWDLQFQAWTLDQWVYSWLAAFLWPALIFGIPLVIVIVWWVRRETREAAPPPQVEGFQQGPGGEV
ncbi:MAG: hypothetical protein JSV43_08900 [Methanobacteriota archaeon]|nr:MAG: hypothetical protein JSV43_08900 [Euryarchaeota archaeon]